MIFGPSGVGKGTLVDRLVERLPVEFSVSVTTRRARPGETDGVDYRFVDDETFQAMVERGELLEHAEYAGSRYGTPRGLVEEHLGSGRDVLLEIELAGARQVRAAYPDALLIFIVPPTATELEERLRGRGDTSPEAMARRLEIARREMQEAPAISDHVVVNDDLEKATTEVVGILQGPSEELSHDD